MKQFVVVLICVLTICCFRAIEPVEVIIPDEPPEPEQICEPDEGPYRLTNSERISVENVSFSPTAGLIGEIEYSFIPECVLVRDDYKPDGIGGRTLQFNLKYSSSDDEARISVFKIGDYKRAFANYPQYVEHRDSELLALIDGSSKLKSFGLEPPPHVRWMDAGELFYSKAKRIDFVDGRGILTLTHITQEGNITISNYYLQFHFQGFTSDGQYFVEMNFPVRFNGIPDESEEFLSPQSSSYNSPDHEAAYKKYLLRTAERIDKAPSRDFRPRMNSIEEFVHGFEVRP